jgi:uncharacterized protein
MHANNVSSKGLMEQHPPQRLEDMSPELARVLTREGETSPSFAVSEIRCKTIWITMRDGVRLATDIYLPPKLPAPAIAMRTPYARGRDMLVGPFMSLARRGYIVISQDCRGTGDSEPDSWDYYLHEAEDGYDLVEWVIRQDWFDGFLGSCGGSYVGQTQWCMATHPRMSTIVPEMSGLGVAVNTAHLYMFCNAYARSAGKGREKVPIHYSELERLMLDETLAGGYFNEPLQPSFSEAVQSRYPEICMMPAGKAKRWLWERYCTLSAAERAAFVKNALGSESVSILEVESLSDIFGHQISHDALTLPHPNKAELCATLQAPALMLTGWYDWGLNDSLATWELLRHKAQAIVRSRSRLIITPSAHNMPGYHEGSASRPELQRTHRTVNNVGLLLRWYAAVRDGTTDAWPRVIYYLMAANQWRIASDWPVPEAQQVPMYLSSGGALSWEMPLPSSPDYYTYDPENPTPTVGGSIVSYVYPPGSVDVSEVQKRPDVLTYTTAPLERDINVVGPLRLILYASSSAPDTDFSARLSDVFPDGRAIQLQSGILRARYRDLAGSPEPLVPGRIYRLNIDMWATANRFMAGHRLRLDVSSADFPRFDRNTNRGGQPGTPIAALQTIYHDPERPSHLLVSILSENDIPG